MGGSENQNTHAGDRIYVLPPALRVSGIDCLYVVLFPLGSLPLIVPDIAGRGACVALYVVALCGLSLFNSDITCLHQVMCDLDTMHLQFGFHVCLHFTSTFFPLII